MRAFIIATNPYNFAWTNEGKCDNTSSHIFTISNNYIQTENGLYISHDGDKVSFTTDISLIDKVNVINRHNVVKIKIGDKYIRHMNSVLYLHHFESTPLFDLDSNWLIFDIDFINVGIVIARYKEDLSWTRYLCNKYKVFIYNKGADDIEISNAEIIKLPNVGRESHTYLTHIINNYDSDIKQTIFLQGNPFPHSPFILELLSIKIIEPFKGLSLWYSPLWPFPNITKSFHKPGHNYTTDYKLDDNLVYLNSRSKFYLVGGNRNMKQQILSFMQKYGIQKRHSGYLVVIAALFACSQDGIRQNDISVYKSLLDASMMDKVTGYIMELLWPTILS